MVIKELVWKITGDSSSAVRAAGQADQAGQKAGKSFANLRKGAMVATAAIVALGAGLAVAVRRQLKAIDEQAKFADRLGISTEAMAGLELAADLTGTTTEKLGTAIQQLERRMGEANEGMGRAGNSLQDLGLSMEEVGDLESEKAFFKVAEALQEVEDRTEQARIANDLFGRQGQDLIGVIRTSGGELGNMADEASRLGLAVSRDAAAQIERFNDQMTRLSALGTGSARRLTVQLAPALNQLADAMFDSAQDGNTLNSVLEGTGQLLSNVIRGAALAIRGFDLLGDAWTAWQDKRSLDAVRREYRATTEEIAKVESQSGKTQQEEIARQKTLVELRQTQNSLWEEQNQLQDRALESNELLEASSERFLDTWDNVDPEPIDRIERSARDHKGTMEEIDDIEDDINDKWRERADLVNQVNQGMQQGLGIISALGQLSAAQNRAKLDRLEAELEAELEAAGVLEETQLEQAEREFDAAVEQGDALAIEEKRRQLEKAKIEDKYRKERLKLEYQAEKDAYNWRVMEAKAAVPLAIMSGLTSGWAAGPVMGPILGPLYAAMSGAAAGIQLSAAKAAKPQPPRFASGGIVPGNSFTGDRVSAQMNSGEMVLNKQQQKQLFSMANGKGGGSQRIIINLGGETLYDQIHKATENGELLIDARAVI